VTASLQLDEGSEVDESARSSHPESPTDDGEGDGDGDGAVTALPMAKTRVKKTKKGAWTSTPS
jgi:hypothetical protein